MGLEIRRNKDGSLKRIWYGRYMLNGSRPCKELCPIRGHAPASWNLTNEIWPINDQGDELFEESRREALGKLTEEKCKAREMQAKDPVRIFEENMSTLKGRKYKVTKVKDLLSEFEKRSAPTSRTKAKDKHYDKWLKATIPTFIRWWSQTKHRENDPITAVTHEDAINFIEFLCKPGPDKKLRCADTISRKKQILVDAFDTCLPKSLSNPFDRIPISRIEGDEIIHREPIGSLDDIQLFLETARKEDKLIYQLAKTGIYTALRKGDLCELKWSDIHLNKKWPDDKGITHQGVIIRKLNKTKVTVSIPMFDPLKDLMDLLFTEQEKDEQFVFPEAARLYRASLTRKSDLPTNQRDKVLNCGNSQLADRLKIVYAKAFAPKLGLLVTDSESEIVELKDILDELKEKIVADGIRDSKKDRLFAALDMYAEGKTFNEISTALKMNKSQISYDFHKAEKLIAPKMFIRNRVNKGPSMKDLVEKVTQKKRTVGAHAASIYDFHALRTTFVTIARAAGMTLEDIRTITGHTDTKMLEQYYDRTKGIAIAQRFTKAAPEFFSATTPKLAISDNSGSLISAPKSEMARQIKSLNSTDRKKLLRNLMQMQQLVLDAEDK